MTETDEKTIPKAQKEFDELLAPIINQITEKDKTEAAQITSKEGVVRGVNITPTIAAEIYSHHNGKNRSVTFSRVFDYVAAMKRGEWRFNHQGIAFYPDGKVADGQHRLAAIAISGIEQKLLVSPSFDKDAIDTIDRSTRRSAGEALEMQGIHLGKLKAGISKVVMAYASEIKGIKSPRFTDQQIEAYVLESHETINTAITLGAQSIENVSEPCLSKTEAQTIALLMLAGKWEPSMAAGFIASIQQGVAPYPESPTVFLSRIFSKAKYADRRKDKLNKKSKLALAMKGAALWAENQSVSQLKWVPAKESLPTNLAPKGHAPGELTI